MVKKRGRRLQTKCLTDALLTKHYQKWWLYKDQAVNKICVIMWELKPLSSDSLYKITGLKVQSPAFHSILTDRTVT